MAGLKDFSDQDLINELQKRGLVPVVWNHEDAAGPILDDEAAEDLDEAQVEKAARLLLARAEEGLNDILGERGNNYLADRWSELSDEILAEVRAAPAP